MWTSASARVRPAGATAGRRAAEPGARGPARSDGRLRGRGGHGRARSARRRPTAASSVGTRRPHRVSASATTRARESEAAIAPPTARRIGDAPVGDGRSKTASVLRRRPERGPRHQRPDSKPRSAPRRRPRRHARRHAAHGSVRAVGPRPALGEPRHRDRLRGAGRPRRRRRSFPHRRGWRTRVRDAGQRRVVGASAAAARRGSFLRRISRVRRRRRLTATPGKRRLRSVPFAAVSSTRRARLDVGRRGERPARPRPRAFPVGQIPTADARAPPSVRLYSGCGQRRVPRPRPRRGVRGAHAHVCLVERRRIDGHEVVLGGRAVDRIRRIPARFSARTGTRSGTPSATARAASMAETSGRAAALRSGKTMQASTTTTATVVSGRRRAPVPGGAEERTNARAQRRCHKPFVVWVTEAPHHPDAVDGARAVARAATDHVWVTVVRRDDRQGPRTRSATRPRRDANGRRGGAANDDAKPRGVTRNRATRDFRGRSRQRRGSRRRRAHTVPEAAIRGPRRGRCAFCGRRCAPATRGRRSGTRREGRATAAPAGGFGELRRAIGTGSPPVRRARRPVARVVRASGRDHLRSRSSHKSRERVRGRTRREVHRASPGRSRAW